MLIQGKYFSLKTEDAVKGQAIVNYMDWAFEKDKDKIVKEATDAFMEGRDIRVENISSL